MTEVNPFFLLELFRAGVVCCLARLPATVQPVSLPAASHWKVLESLWSEASLSTLHPLCPHLIESCTS